jgi:hypothetical protein
MITGKDEMERDAISILRYPQLSWVLYSQAARAISTG